MPDHPSSNERVLKPWMTYSILALAVLVSGYFIYGAWKGPSELEPSLMCCKCGYTQTGELEVGMILPAQCPKCGQDAALMTTFSCPKCRTINIWNEDLKLPPPTRCRKCGQEVRHGR